MSTDNDLCQVCGDLPYFYCMCQETVKLCATHSKAHLSKGESHQILPITPSGMSLVSVGPEKEGDRQGMINWLGESSDRIAEFVKRERSGLDQRMEEYRNMFVMNFNASVGALKREMLIGYEEIIKELARIKQELELASFQPEFTLSQPIADYVKTISHFSSPLPAFLSVQQLVSTRVQWDGTLESKPFNSAFASWLNSQNCPRNGSCPACIQAFTRLGLKQYTASSILRPSYDRAPVSVEQEAATWSCSNCGHPYNLKGWQQCSKCGQKNIPSGQRSFRRIQSQLN